MGAKRPPHWGRVGRCPAAPGEDSRAHAQVIGRKHQSADGGGADEGDLVVLDHRQRHVTEPDILTDQRGGFRDLVIEIFRNPVAGGEPLGG
ncbi:MAG: hypothetical protein OEZ19_03880 [Paracoccaceae bacterium]|nr:hypothetical protein [Paracoccaceae bacterium]